MKAWPCIFGIVIGLSLAMTASAAEVVQVCGKYRRSDQSWSHGYKLTGEIMNGDEMHLIVRYKAFSPSQKYLLVRWKKGGYNYYQVGEQLPVTFEKTYKDQNGKRWTFRQGWSGCN